MAWKQAQKINIHPGCWPNALPPWKSSIPANVAVGSEVKALTYLAGVKNVNSTRQGIEKQLLRPNTNRRCAFGRMARPHILPTI
jgi:hypothetical protein